MADEAEAAVEGRELCRSAGEVATPRRVDLLVNAGVIFGLMVPDGPVWAQAGVREWPAPESRSESGHAPAGEAPEATRTIDDRR